MLLEELKTRFPKLKFEPGESFLWSPAQQLICYPEASITEDSGIWALLHEAAHGILGHEAYETDFELLTLEVAAWERAKQLGKDLGITINEDHVQDCLDTYRDWLHRRSTCPTCGVVALQRNSREYGCHNCHTTWQVTNSRFCRAYRMKNHHQTKTTPETKPQTLFR